MGDLEHLRSISLWKNKITKLPKTIKKLTSLQSFDLNNVQLEELPDEIGYLSDLQRVDLSNNNLKVLPKTIKNLNNLKEFYIKGNSLSDLPNGIGNLDQLQELKINDNPLNPQLFAIYDEGIGILQAYLRARAIESAVLNEAKLILIGEGDVGKTCLMESLQNNPFQSHDSTHGIQISSFKVKGINDITINGWDFGGQTVYRPTHQLFFTAPAIYLIVWKAREGITQGFVEEWMELVQRREPSAKMIIVATHARDRQADIDMYALKARFGDNLIGHFAVDNKPDEQSNRLGIEDLKQEIARVAATLPEMGQRVPKRWQDTRDAFEATDEPYIKLDEALNICLQNGMSQGEAEAFMDVSRRLGHITYYPHDNVLKDIVILKPDWLAQAISLVLDDAETRQRGGLVPMSRLSTLWNNPNRTTELRYPEHLHPIFVRLMERFDLSYKVTDIPNHNPDDPESLIAQLVRQDPPTEKVHAAWDEHCQQQSHATTQKQVCRILEEQTGQPAKAEGLLFQLIVRFHKYSLGKDNYENSVHWKRGLVLDDSYNGRAFLEEKDDGIHITVHAAYPATFLAILVDDIKHLIDQYWKGLRYEVGVPCPNTLENGRECTGFFGINMLHQSKQKNRHEFPCSVCGEWLNIDDLLNITVHSSTAEGMNEVSEKIDELKDEVLESRAQAAQASTEQLAKLDYLKSLNEQQFYRIMNALADEAKEGPRLFTLTRVHRNKRDSKEYISRQYRLTLWCEHARLPIHIIEQDEARRKGVYDIDVSREWFAKAAKHIKNVSQVLSVALPVAASGIKLALDSQAYGIIEQELDLTMSTTKNILAVGKTADNELMSSNLPDYAHEDDLEPLDAEGAALRELHVLLKQQDSSERYGGLVRVMDNQGKFLWVHPKFAGEY
ncbi:MAG: COR domain-containing protein [Deinococcota bacterium]